jgi:hypothetical protein
MVLNDEIEGGVGWVAGTAWVADKLGRTDAAPTRTVPRHPSKEKLAAKRLVIYSSPPFRYWSMSSHTPATMSR